ncbi:MAG: NAD(P)/FAD-dependent oxidoreductase [Marmoricola sp.]
MNTDIQHSIRVVVIGAGYAGAMATNRFLGSLRDDERRRVRVTVVNPRPMFVERVRLHQLAAGSRGTVTLPLAAVLHRDATVLLGWATRIDAAARTVRVSMVGEEVELGYDYLVYAPGSAGAAPVSGAREHGFLLGDFEGAIRTADAIRSAGPRPRIAVVGGGFTGIEAASELAEQHPQAEVTLYSAGPFARGMRPAAGRSLAKALRRLGVRIEENAVVSEIEDGKLRLGADAVHAFDVCVLATAFAVPDLAQVSGLAVDRVGRLEVDEQLRSLSDPSILGAGDAVVAPDAVAGHLRMGCATALPLGAHAAEVLLATLRGTAAPPLSIGFIAQCISLGRKNGYIQLVRSDDTPRATHVGGRLGAVVKERICEMVLDAPMKERTRPGAYTWPKGPHQRPAA